MHFSTALLTLSAAALASAKGLVVDAATKDGIYTFDINNATEITEITDYPVPLETPAARSAKMKRAPIPSNRRVGCTGNSTPQDGDEHAAWEKLAFYCRGGGDVTKNEGVFAKVGEKVWYVCNYSGNNQPCSWDEMDQAGGILGRECHDQGGWVGIDDWAKMYGRELQNVGICNGKNLHQLW